MTAPWGNELVSFTGFRIVGLVVGLAGLALVYWPHSVLEWFAVSAVFGFMGFRFPGSPGGAFFLGLWLACFWVPGIAGVLRLIGVLG